MYSLFWNHIVGKTRSLHVLTPCIQKPENERAVPDRATPATFIFWFLNAGVSTCKDIVFPTIWFQKRLYCSTGTSGYFWAPSKTKSTKSTCSRRGTVAGARGFSTIYRLCLLNRFYGIQFYGFRVSGYARFRIPGSLCMRGSHA
jgi:hypothetical protein